MSMSETPEINKPTLPFSDFCSTWSFLPAPMSRPSSLDLDDVYWSSFSCFDERRTFAKLLLAEQVMRAWLWEGMRAWLWESVLLAWGLWNMI
jgi:hypothetical protein